MHILLIDDSSSTRSLIRTLINSGQAARHEISEAASGEEALQKVQSGEIAPPHLILVDINMGGMSGYDLCRAFRLRPGSTDLAPYIIVITANEGVEVINQALEAGANDYMPKPVNVKILHVRLRVAERLLTLALSGLGSGPIPVLAPTSSPVPAPPSEPAQEIDPRQALIAAAVEQTDVPIALVEAGGEESSFRIIYTNGAMSTTTGFSQEQMLGKSLADMEAWTPEFLKMTLGFTSRGASLSHVPLWSKTRQEFPIYLSFCPVLNGEAPVSHYLVIHHL
jgi:CheY-like chemotaxis protein